MFNPTAIEERRLLRYTITSSLPNKTACELFDILKEDGKNCISFNSILFYSKMAKIPVQHIPALLYPYGVKKKYLTKSQFVNFINDDLPLNSVQKKHMSKYYYNILYHYITRFRYKNTCKVHDMWQSAINMNAANSLCENQVTVYALCRIYRGMNLPYSLREFVAGLYLFYGRKFDTLNFQEFAQLIQAF